jgi:hypothetical protein
MVVLRVIVIVSLGIIGGIGDRLSLAVRLREWCGIG